MRIKERGLQTAQNTCMALVRYKRGKVSHLQPQAAHEEARAHNSGRRSLAFRYLTMLKGKNSKEPSRKNLIFLRRNTIILI